MSKILMYSTGQLFLDKQTGGIKRFVELTKYLQEKYDADLCCQDTDATLKEYGLKGRYTFCQSESTGFSILPPEACRVWENRKLIKQIKEARYDRVISFDVPPTIGLCLLGVKNIVLMVRKDLIGYEKTVNASQNSIKKFFKLAYLWLAEDITLRKCKYIVVQCEYDKNQLLDRHKFLSSKVENKFKVQINNVNPSWVVSKSSDIREACNKSKDFTVGFIGNFSDRRKGHDLLLEAAAQLIKKGHLLRFEIIGDGKELEKFRSKYQNERITFHGRLNNPMKVIKDCDLTVVPSRADSCPNTVMESLYNEVPVIGAKIGGIPEILLDREALFEIEVQSLVSRIEEYYIDASKLKRLAENQVRRKKELEFNWAEKITDLII